MIQRTSVVAGAVRTVVTRLGVALCELLLELLDLLRLVLGSDVGARIARGLEECQSTCSWET